MAVRRGIGGARKDRRRGAVEASWGAAGKKMIQNRGKDFTSGAFYYIMKGKIQAEYCKTSAQEGNSLKYILGSFRYLFKNFIFIFFFVLLPSFFFAMTIDLDNAAEVIGKFLDSDSLISFPHILTLVSPVNAHGWPYALLFVASVVVCLPFLLGYIEKHMRIGTRSLKGVFGRFNYNFLTTLLVSVIFLAVFEAWSVLTSGMIYAAVSLFTGGVRLFMSLVIFFAMVALMCWAATVLLLWLPCMQVNGYGALEALSYSNRLVNERRGGLFLSVFLPALAGVILVLAVAALSDLINVYVPVFVAVFIIVDILFLYYCTLMFVAYFDLTGEERADLRKKF